MQVSNRTIWTLWHQGYAGAPAIVTSALESWRRLNAGWRVVALDQNSLGEWIDLGSVIDLKRKDLTLQKIAAIARLCLLRRYGGVWADATVYCCRPLDDWLPQIYGSGFFVFRNPGPDRLASNWFIAAECDHPLLVGQHEGFLRLWRTTFFANQNNRFGKKAIALLSPILNKNVHRTMWWTSPAMLKLLRAYPYFLFHYLFNRNVLSDPGLRRLWEESPQVEASPCHRLQLLSRKADGRSIALREIEQEAWTVQKLDWRCDPSKDPYWHAVLAALAARLSVAEAR